MREHAKAIGTVLLLAVLATAGAWWWFQTMELRWNAHERESDAARENRLLGATLLLRKNSHPVTLSSTLGELSVPRIADGTLVMSDAYGVITPAAAQELLAWVRRGNTLVMQPRELSYAEEAAYTATLAPHEAAADDVEEEDDSEVAGEDQAAAPAEELESDPIGARLGVRSYWEAPPPCAASAAGAPAKVKGKRCTPPPAPLRRLALPGNGYWIELDPRRHKLVGMEGAPAPLWSDEQAGTVRAYAEGKGRIVLLAYDFFGNAELRKHDHAELLLALAALNPGHKHVTLVQHLNMLPWYQALWVHYRALLVSLACCLVLSLWAAMRRFGPLLPQPAGERRSLMEHIDASGAWLWKTDGGRQLLFEAAREETLALVRRRAPKLARLPPQQMAEALARLAGLDEQHVMQALQQEAEPKVAGFTRQIRTLQELRNHHER